MALANSRPLDIPTLDDELIANSKSPLFDASTLANSAKAFPESESDKTKPSGKHDSKAKKNSNGSFASSQLTDVVSISKTIPVTGERPKPENNGPILNEDDVLYAIFVILWESDPGQQGMTVKQLCDLLLEKHPEMNNLSTKLSNLISAKLNAYVKKVEKGEKGLSYALSREWSDASPRRMVYIYRGILAPDYQKHAQAAAAALAAASTQLSDNGSNPMGKNKTKSKKQLAKSTSDLGMEIDGSQSTDYKDGAIPRSSSAMSGLKSSTFSAGNFVNDFNIPYMSSPVSVSLTPKLEELSLSHVSNDLDIDSHITLTGKRLSMGQDRPGKKMKMEQVSISLELQAGQVQQQQPVYITIASSTPRLSRNSSKHHDSNNTATSSETAQTVAEILKTVVTQNPIVITPRSSKASSPLASAASSQDYTKHTKEKSCQWLRSLRDGFLLEEIPTPESLSPDELDEFFT